MGTDVLVLGDTVFDLFVYDKRTEDDDKSLAWTSPLSRDEWRYSEGFETRKCAAGAAAIHAMLALNNIFVDGNAFRENTATRNPEKSGSVIVLRKRPNPGKDKAKQTRTYLVHKNENTGKKDEEGNGSLQGRNKTWRAVGRLLNERETKYVDPIRIVDGILELPGGVKLSDLSVDQRDLKVVCLVDLRRGFFPEEKEGVQPTGWQTALADWLCELLNDRPEGYPALSIVIRTSDPSRFEEFLNRIGDPERSEPRRPSVVLVCARGNLDDGNLKASGTWSAVWRHVHEYLTSSDYAFLHSSNDSTDGNNQDWKFHIAVPIYQDGVIWFGPGCWPVDETVKTVLRKAALLSKNELPLGRLFVVPGAQPGLSEFQRNERMLGVHTMLTHDIVEHLAHRTQDEPLQLNDIIRRSLLQMRRLVDHGYCSVDELTECPMSKEQTAYIGYPLKVWKDNERDCTDHLLHVMDTKTLERAGPYEVRCKVGEPSTLAELKGGRVFEALEKCVPDKDGVSAGEFVASPTVCRNIINDFDPERFRDLNIVGSDKKTRAGKPNIPCVNIKDGDASKEILRDSFVSEEIKSFRLAQRISMQFGGFALADPKAAGSILDLAQRIKQHALTNRFKSPDQASVFNFALFGTPGSGKSFLAKEMARSIDPKGEIFTTIEHNLSQFTDPKQLSDALEGIAGKGVGGRVPFVLWDEFDSVFDQKRGGWLARFLMPMQDAYFFDGRERRPIGTAVFVFIGGTFPNAENFRDWTGKTKPDTNGDDPPEAVLLKGRDFHSRLYTALDMPRIIDEQKVNDKEKPLQIFRINWNDCNYNKLSRAVLLRVYFKDHSKVGKEVVLKKVEDGLCKFLLAIPLRHGARSLQRIVEACLVNKPTEAKLLHLPPTQFLEEHIETENVLWEERGVTGMKIEEMIEACRN